MNIVIFSLMIHDVIPVGSTVFSDWYREAAYVYFQANNKSYICKGKVSKCNLLYSTVRKPHDCSKRSTLYYLADMFNRTTSQLFWEASSHATINSQKLFVYTYPLLSTARSHSYS